MPDDLDSVGFFILILMELHIWNSRYLLSIRVPALYVIDINVYWLSTKSKNKNAFFGNR